MAPQPAEIDQARQLLRSSCDGIAAATVGLSEAQFNFKPAPDSWSIAEILEHVAMVHAVVLGPVRQGLAAAPPPPADRDYRRADALIVNRLPDRSGRFNGPAAVHPAGRSTPAASVEAVRSGTTALIEYLENTPDLRRHAIESLPMKAISSGEYDTMDGYQWILAAAGHAARHTLQIEEVKANPNYPK
ncbi:MAG: DinB family protein [Acidobacteriota bacterium]|nr:DinB family protein [Acidobacteriota bacterium]